jgi:hypothetical protein
MATTPTNFYYLSEPNSMTELLTLLWFQNIESCIINTSLFSFLLHLYFYHLDMPMYLIQLLHNTRLIGHCITPVQLSYFLKSSSELDVIWNCS